MKAAPSRVEVPTISTLLTEEVACAYRGPSARTPPLTEGEIRVWNEMKGGARRDHWLAGRIAVKDAVRRACHRYDVQCPGPAGIHISASTDQADLGRPIVHELPLHVSLSHSHGLAVGAASIAPVGVDVEAIHRPWPREVLLLLDDISEERASRRVSAAATWTCLEAVLKMHGCGLRYGVRTVRIDKLWNSGPFTWTERAPLPRPRQASGWVTDLGSHSLAVVWGQS